MKSPKKKSARPGNASLARASKTEKLNETLVSEFDYRLPEERIAQKPAEPRESARLMILDRMKDALTHEHVRDIPAHLKRGDVLVINDTKVFRARLKGKIETASGRKRPAEILLVKTLGDVRKFPFWTALAKPGRHFEKGRRFSVAEGFEARVIEKAADGTVTLDFYLTKGEVMDLADAHGEVPLPPYISATDDNTAGYQTSYARLRGSVAAPTAGFHLTKPLLEKMKRKGVIVKSVTLHVGLGTFMPIRSEKIEEHRMHSEWVDISEEAAVEILKAKVDGRRVISAGTTTLRALEGAAEKCGGDICPWHGDVDLFITPGFRFRVVDALLTNFHLPKSTLLILVSSFATRKQIMGAYEDAVRREYRFFSYGDAMFIE